MAVDLGTIFARLKLDAKQFHEDVDKATEHAKKFSDGVGSIFSSAGKIVAAGLATAAGGAVALGRSMVKGAADVETYRSILTTLTGSAEAAGQKLDWLREFAKKTPFELPGLIEATTRLEAYGLRAEDLMGTLGDTAAALGKDVMAAVEAIADAQTGEFERLKEFGIKAVQEGGQTALLYTDRYGKEQKVLVDRNNREMVTSTIQAIWNERYGGAMETMSTTWKGMVSNMRDALTSTLADLGSTILPALKPVVDAITGAFSSDTFKNALAGLANVFVSLAPLAEKVVGFISEFIAKAAPVLEGLFARLVPLISSLLDRLLGSGIFDSLLRIFDVVAGTFLTAIQSLAPTLISIVDIVLKIAAPIIEIASKAHILEALIYAWVASKIWTTASQFVTTITNLAGSLTQATSAAGGLSGVLSGGMGFATIITLAGAAIGVVNQYAEAAKKAWAECREAEQQLANQAKQAIDAQKEALSIFALTKDKVDTNTEAYRRLYEGARAAGIEEGTAHQFAAVGAQGHSEAISLLSAKYSEYLDRAQNSSGKEKEMWDQRARELKNYMVEAGYEIAAFRQDGEALVKSAIETCSAIPQIALDYLVSSVPEFRTTGEAAVQKYVEGLLGTEALAGETGQKISTTVAEALKSSDPQVKSNAAETVRQLALSLAENGQISYEQAKLLGDNVAAALDKQKEAEEAGRKTAEGYGKGIEEMSDEVKQKVINTFKNILRGLPGLGQLVFGWHSGGLVRAHSGLLAPDEIPAILQRGEYVIRRAAVDYYGRELFDLLNSRVLNPTTISIGQVNLPGVQDAQGFVKELGELARRRAYLGG